MTRSGNAPHIRSPRTTQSVMLDVVIALIPPACAATWYFGWRVPLMILVGIATALISEALWQKATRQPVTIHDGSALVTGTLMGLSLPVTAPFWTIVVGTLIAVVGVKHLLGGGLGRNRLNPAVTGRVALKVFFSPWITNWILPGVEPRIPTPDLMTTATPLSYVGDGARTVLAPSEVPSLLDLFMGHNLGGNVGETATIAILLGCLYLVVRGVIELKTPLLFIGSAVAVAGFWSAFDLNYMMVHLLSGTLVFGAVYMATDYSSGALTPQGKTIVPILGGVLTMILRIAFDFPGGFGIALIVVNLFTPMIDKYLAPRIYGRRTRPMVKDSDRQPWTFWT